MEETDDIPSRRLDLRRKEREDGGQTMRGKMGKQEGN